GRGMGKHQQPRIYLGDIPLDINRWGVDNYLGDFAHAGVPPVMVTDVARYGDRPLRRNDDGLAGINRRTAQRQATRTEKLMPPRRGRTAIEINCTADSI